jgi:hypothetical protein
LSAKLPESCDIDAMFFIEAWNDYLSAGHLETVRGEAAVVRSQASMRLAGGE